MTRWKREATAMSWRTCSSRDTRSGATQAIEQWFEEEQPDE